MSTRLHVSNLRVVLQNDQESACNETIRMIKLEVLMKTYIFPWFQGRFIAAYAKIKLYKMLTISI